MRSETMNEEQAAQGRKEAGIKTHPIYAATPKDRKVEAGEANGHAPAVLVYIEAERFYDARALAQRVLGAPEVSIARLDSPRTAPLPRWQTRWTGTTGGSDPLRMQARIIESEATLLENGWREMANVP